MEARVNGLRLFYRDSGLPKAPAVVFIHGFPFDHTQWREQADLLGETFRVITYDQRGHGRSGAGDRSYLFERFVDDLFGLLDILRLRKAILCGLSMGGYVALRAAERQPHRVQGLILCDTRSEADGNEAKLKRAAAIRTVQAQGIPAFAEGFLKNVFAPSTWKTNPAAVERIRRSILRTSPQGLCSALVALATRTDTTAALAGIHVPTLILVGDQDALTPLAASESMRDRIAGSQLSVIANAAHLSNVENPAEFNHCLFPFLQSLDA